MKVSQSISEVKLRKLNWYRKELKEHRYIVEDREVIGEFPKLVWWEWFGYQGILEANLLSLCKSVEGTVIPLEDSFSLMRLSRKGSSYELKSLSSEKCISYRYGEDSSNSPFAEVLETLVDTFFPMYLKDIDWSDLYFFAYRRQPSRVLEVFAFPIKWKNSLFADKWNIGIVV